MAREAILHQRYKKTIEKLSPERVKALILAMFDYAESGEHEELDEVTDIAFTSIQEQMEYDDLQYQEKCKKNRENIRKRWNKRDTTVYDRIPTDTKHTNTNTNTNTKSNKDIPPTPLKRGEDILETNETFKGLPSKTQCALKDWIEYKKEKRQAYKAKGLQSLITQVARQTERHGEDAVVSLIDECMASNWQGIIWDRLPRGEPRAGTEPKRVDGGFEL